MDKTKFQILIFSLIIFIQSFPAYSHPGHGFPEESFIQHYFFEPEHGLYFLPIILLVSYLIFRAVKKKKRS